MNRACTGFLLALVLFACNSSSQTSDAGTPGNGGAGGAETTGNGGSGATVRTPLVTVADCGSIAASDLKPGTTQTTATTFAPGQLVAGRVDPDSLTNQEHHWVLQLAPGFYHLVLDGRTADGASTNIGLRVTRHLADGNEEPLVLGNEIARHYRDEAFFEVKAAGLVPLTVSSQFKMADYLMGVFANGTPVPSPLFDKCPTVMPLTLATTASFALGATGTAKEEQWFLVDLAVGNYKFMLDATQADGMDTNLIYYVDVLDRFGQESRAKQVVFENQIGSHFAAQGTLAVSETGSYWVRLRNDNKDLNVTMTVGAQ